MNTETIIEFSFLWCEELCRPRRMLSTSVDNILLDLHNSPHPTQPSLEKQTFILAHRRWGERSPAAMSEEKRLFSQATLSHIQ